MPDVTCPVCWTWVPLGKRDTCKTCGSPLMFANGLRVDGVDPPAVEFEQPEIRPNRRSAGLRRVDESVDEAPATPAEDTGPAYGFRENAGPSGVVRRGPQFVEDAEDGEEGDGEADEGGDAETESEAASGAEGEVAAAAPAAAPRSDPPSPAVLEPTPAPPPTAVVTTATTLTVTYSLPPPAPIAASTPPLQMDLNVGDAPASAEPANESQVVLPLGDGDNPSGFAAAPPDGPPLADTAPDAEPPAAGGDTQPAAAPALDTGEITEDPTAPEIMSELIVEPWPVPSPEPAPPGAAEVPEPVEPDGGGDVAVPAGSAEFGDTAPMTASGRQEGAEPATPMPPADTGAAMVDGPRDTGDGTTAGDDAVPDLPSDPARAGGMDAATPPAGEGPANAAVAPSPGADGGDPSDGADEVASPSSEPRAESPGPHEPAGPGGDLTDDRPEDARPPAATWLAPPEQAAPTPDASAAQAGAADPHTAATPGDDLTETTWLAPPEEAVAIPEGAVAEPGPVAGGTADGNAAPISRGPDGGATPPPESPAPPEPEQDGPTPDQAAEVSPGNEEPSTSDSDGSDQLAHVEPDAHAGMNGNGTSAAHTFNTGNPGDGTNDASGDPPLPTDSGILPGNPLPGGAGDAPEDPVSGMAGGSPDEASLTGSASTAPTEESVEGARAEPENGESLTGPTTLQEEAGDEPPASAAQEMAGESLTGALSAAPAEASMEADTDAASEPEGEDSLTGSVVDTPASHPGDEALAAVDDSDGSSLTGSVVTEETELSAEEVSPPRDQESNAGTAAPATGMTAGGAQATEPSVDSGDSLTGALSAAPAEASIEGDTDAAGEPGGEDLLTGSVVDAPADDLGDDALAAADDSDGSSLTGSVVAEEAEMSVGEVSPPRDEESNAGTAPLATGMTAGGAEPSADSGESRTVLPDSSEADDAVAQTDSHSHSGEVPSARPPEPTEMPAAEARAESDASGILLAPRHYPSIPPDAQNDEDDEDAAEAAEPPAAAAVPAPTAVAGISESPDDAATPDAAMSAALTGEAGGADSGASASGQAAGSAGAVDDSVAGSDGGVATELGATDSAAGDSGGAGTGSVPAEQAPPAGQPKRGRFSGFLRRGRSGDG